MALGTAFNELVEMVRDECRTSTNSSRGIDNEPYLQRLIKRNYEVLCDKYDWTFLRVDKNEATKVLQKGERYYDFPVAMDVRYAISAHVFWGNVYLSLSYGIGPLEYSAYNSDNPAVTADPVLKWQIVADGQFEVWPMPASTGNIDVLPPQGPFVRFEGKRLPRPLVADDDPCDMDDQLIVLYSAAEILEQQEKGKGQVKLAAAVDRLSTLKGMFSDHRKVRMGMGNPDSRNNGMSPGWPRIRVFPASN